MRSDLIFVHTLFSHNPYGFDEKCGYDGSRSMIQHKKNIDWKINQNNIERVCVVNKLDKSKFNLISGFIIKKSNSRIFLDIILSITFKLFFLILNSLKKYTKGE